MTYEIKEDFLLETDVARNLYERIRGLPIIDYHSHLPIDVIAGNKPFANLTDIWIRGDHYKWRAMRLNGIPERYCSGKASDVDKFKAWARTVPLTIRSPLHHWSCLELKRYFGIQTELTPDNAAMVWETANALLRTDDFRPRDLLRRMQVEVLCTSDDPVDSLEYHYQLRDDTGFAVKVFPTFRPDRALAIDDRDLFDSWLKRLEKAACTDITNLDSFLVALRTRHEAFSAAGCCISDHGLERCYALACSDGQAQKIFGRYLCHESLNPTEIEQWRSYLMREFARWDQDKGWTMLLHLGALRNNNSRIYAAVGFDTGCDSIGDFDQARALNGFLNSLDAERRLPKTVIFNSNARDNLLFATVAGNFFGDNVVGKVRCGPPWWFLDHAEGIRAQLDALSQVGLFPHFVGMTTDSRSFLSFPRHDYFRRVVCNVIGDDVRRGLVPGDMDRLERTLRGVFYENALNCFDWKSA